MSKSIAQEHSVTANSAQPATEPAITRLQVAHAITEPRCPTLKVLNECVIPVMTYGSETWALTTAQMDTLAVAQRKNRADYAGHNTS